MARKPQTQTISPDIGDIATVFGRTTSFHGILEFQKPLQINGRFEGEIVTPDTLVVGESARVKGDIEAGVVIISGEVNGNIRAKYRVEIHKPAVFRGDIFTPSLSVDEGVIFEGQSKMVQSSPQSEIHS